MNDSWLTEAVAASVPFDNEPTQDTLISKLLQWIDNANLGVTDRRIALGAAFDLLIAAEYYGLVAHLGWLYCANPQPVLFYPYTNICPHCILQGRFEFHRANKPRSGAIGATTSRMLGQFIAALIHRRHPEIEVRRGREPVDAIFIDRTTSPTTLFFVEIKASPLVTLPLAVATQALSSEISKESYQTHRETDLPTLYDTTLSMLVPGHNESDGWQAIHHPIGAKQNAEDSRWAYRGLQRLLDTPAFFEQYLSFWHQAFKAYRDRDTDATAYWFTNGCGQPVPRPPEWPRRSGTGYESVSDSKTSVGMDRTDDIKKATYQVLKLGAEGKPNRHYRYKTGIISNIHAVRHFDEYLRSLKDIIWTREAEERTMTAGQLPPDTPLFNLFDGIVTLTDIQARDEWVRNVFDL